MAAFYIQGAQAPWGEFRFLQGYLGKSPKNCPNIVYKKVGGSSLPFSYTKPQVFIVYYYNLQALCVLTTNNVIS